MRKAAKKKFKISICKQKKSPDGALRPDRALIKCILEEIDSVLVQENQECRDQLAIFAKEELQTIKFSGICLRIGRVGQNPAGKIAVSVSLGKEMTCLSRLREILSEIGEKIANFNKKRSSCGKLELVRASKDNRFKQAWYIQFNLQAIGP